MSASREQDPVRSLAGRIASRIAEESAREKSPMASRDAAHSGDELSQLRATVSEMRQRLAQIESRVTKTPRPATAAAAERADETRVEPSMEVRSSSQNEQRASSASQMSNMPAHWLSGTYVPAVHPSEERFGIDEAVSELVEFFEREKVCNVEPGGKPCDHCGMCSARGF